MKVLLVDDNKTNLMMMEKFINRMSGFECITASDGSEGRNKFIKNKDHIFIVFTDENMPNLTGSQLAQFIKKSNPDTPVVITTGVSSTIKKIKASVADEIINKPISYTDMALIIRKFYRKLNAHPTRSQIEVKETLDEIVKKLSIKHKSKSTERINISAYKVEINKKLSIILSTIHDWEDEFLSLQNKVPVENLSLNNHIKGLVNTTTYCRCLLILYSSIFHKRDLTVSTYDIGNIVKRIHTVLGINASSKRLKFDKRAKNKLKKTNGKTIENDRQLLEACLFSILLNLNDFSCDQSSSIQINNGLGANKTPYISFEFSSSRFIKEKNGKKIIAIIDDDSYYSNVLSSVLQENQYEVFTYDSGYEFFDFFEHEIESTPDLIVLDVQMKGMPGTEVLKNFRLMRRYSHVPIIIISGNTNVLSSKFKELMAKYSPVKMVYKDPTKLFDEFPNHIEEELSIENKHFEFKELFNMELEDSIKSDHLLGLGLNPVKNIFDSLGIDVEFEENSYDHKITLHFSGRTDMDLKIESIDPLVSRYYFDKMNEYVRHELKNKLGSLSFLIKRIKENIRSNDKIKDFIKIEHNHNQATEIFKYLEDIKNI